MRWQRPRARSATHLIFAAEIWSVAALAHWTVLLVTGIELTSRFDPRAWHIHELLIGFVMGGVAGFLLLFRHAAAFLTPAQMRREGAVGVGNPPRKGRCSRIGRGQAAADRLKFAGSNAARASECAASWSRRGSSVEERQQRSATHLRYLQRDGTTREGEPGRLYGHRHAADGRRVCGARAGGPPSVPFHRRARGRRPAFRSARFTRDVMSQMQDDLGTRLDWVAVDHFNTGRPHSHVVIRGKDETGKDLIIAQDYITDGVRLRAQERVTLELGPESDLELRQKLTAEIAAERFTRIDRAMIAEAPDRVLDLRPEAGQVRADFDRTLRIGRLQTLARYGLATEIEPGVWALSENLEPTLRDLGERGDIVKAINRALTDRGEERALVSYVLHGEQGSSPIVGRVIGKGLTDELGERIGLIVDCAGRSHLASLKSML